MPQDPDELVRLVTRRVGELRRSKGVSQAEAARRFRTALQNWRRIEAGQNLTIHTLGRIAAALGAEPIEFFQEAPPAKPKRSRAPAKAPARRR